MNSRILVLVLVLFPVFNTSLWAQTTVSDGVERTYILSKIWRELHSHFAFPENLEKANIDSLYKEYLVKVEKVNNDLGFYRSLSEFMAYFNDGHTRIIASKRPDDAPSISVTNFGRKVVVCNIAKEYAGRIPVGSEVLELNHVPVLGFINDSVCRYISAGNRQWKFNKAVTEMFYGKPLSKVSVTVRTPQGEVNEVEMVRSYNANGKTDEMVEAVTISPIQVKIMNNNIGYIQLGNFSGQYADTIKAVFNANLPQLSTCKGIIIDVRGNRGGSDMCWYDIVFRLIAEPQFGHSGQWVTRKSVTCYKMWGEDDPQFVDYYLDKATQPVIYPSYTNGFIDSLQLTQPLVVLSDKYVGSATEDFVLLLKELGRATVIGKPSVGVMGVPLFMPLTNNYTAMIAGIKYVNENGTQINDTGILPDIYVERDYDSYIKGLDNQLDKGILYLAGSGVVDLLP